MADSNFLRDDGLRAYLQHSPEHRIVLAELTLIEMFKKNAMLTARESLKIVSDFPEQVFVLKPTHTWLNYRVRTEEDLTNIIDLAGTEELRQLCRDYRSPALAEGFAEKMNERELAAAEYISRLNEQILTWEASLASAQQRFGEEQLIQIRTRKDVSDATRTKILELVKEITAEFILTNQEPGRTERMKLKEARDMFAFRYALCIVINFTIWIEKGRTQKRQDRLLNDVVDNQLAAISTFFNEVLSRDKGLLTVADNARDVLKHIGAFVRPFPKEATS